MKTSPVLTPESREAGAQAWLEVLRRRHPGVVWTLVKK